MGAAIPKQYLPLAGSTVIEQTLDRLLANPSIRAICVSLGAHDGFWPELAIARHERVLRAPGGEERCHSVLNGLATLMESAGADPGDWVLVHDAARPCLAAADLQRLLDELRDDPVGGILAFPVRDTMKRASADGRIARTEDRTGLWHALTPQMFRLGALHQAISQALADGFLVTDEASAMEHAGHEPRLIEGRADNIKVTRPEDLAVAGFFLEQEARA